jgi:hypothetical protein
MKDYLAATNDEIARTKDEGSFYFAMVQRFPEANLFISSRMNAGVFKGGMVWNSLWQHLRMQQAFLRTAWFGAE